MRTVGWALEAEPDEDSEVGLGMKAAGESATGPGLPRTAHSHVWWSVLATLWADTYVSPLPMHCCLAPNLGLGSENHAEIMPSS